MSNFVEKIGEKLHLGGHKKEGEQEHPPLHAGEHPPLGSEYAGHAQPQGEGQLGSHPQHGYGGEHGYAGGAHGEHRAHYDQHGVGAPPQVQHEGPFEKHGGGEGDSSSESDGEGGRRKKHGTLGELLKTT